MKFARQEIRERTQGISKARRHASSVVIAIVASVIVRNMVSDKVYAAAGLDAERAKREARNNEHHKTMLRSSCRHLMEFLSDAGLLTRPAMAVYKQVNMV